MTNLAVAGSWTHRLNRPWQAQVTIPSDEYIAAIGLPLRIENDGDIVHHGQIQQAELTQDEDTGYVVYNSQDPMELWQWRPVRDDDCDFSLPQIITDYITGPQIIEAMLLNSEGDGGCSHADCVDADAGDCEGPLFLDYGTFEGGGVSLEGAPTDWPMTMAQLSSLLISTGALDIVLTPINPGGGIMSEVSAYNGDFGNNLVTGVVFEYGTGAFNIAKFRFVEDMTVMCNKLWYFMGPRVGTPSDPQGLQHWCYNVQGDDPGLPDPIPNGESLATLLTNRDTSRTDFGVRMDIQIFDAGECLADTEEPCCFGDPLTAQFRELYRNRWETESWIRQQPRNLLHITPTRETAIGDFEVGDIIGIEIPMLGISAGQRVYEFTVSWDGVESVLALSELQTSPTADG